MSEVSVGSICFIIGIIRSNNVAAKVRTQYTATQYLAISKLFI